MACLVSVVPFLDGILCFFNDIVKRLGVLHPVLVLLVGVDHGGDEVLNHILVLQELLARAC